MCRAWLRPNRTRLYSYHYNPDGYTDAHVTYYSMTQYALNSAGLKRFGRKAKDAVTKKLLPLHMQNTFIPLDPKYLSDEEEREALGSLIFIKKKGMEQ